MLLHRSWLLLGFFYLAAACAQATPPPTREPTAIVPTALPTGVLPPATPVATGAAGSGEEESCGETAGQVIQAELVDKELPRSLPYRVYLPPCASQAQGQLPTLYLLHGLARTDAQWDELNADEVAQRLVVSDMAFPFLIVMPW